ncbi:unnamed protein product [Ascophyllum nodosum]
MSQAEDAGEVLTLEKIVRDAEKHGKRRTSVSLALPVCPQGLAASVEISGNEVEFEAHGVIINHEGLFIDGTNVSTINLDDLQILSELGRGACSVVKKAQHVETRELYAIKVFSVFDREKRAQLLKEVETLCGMDCPSLVGFVGGYLKDGSIHVVLEYMDRGSLGDLIHSWTGVEYGEDLMAAITFQMLWGLGYMHFEHHLHRDVKPQNVLISSKGEVKLSDFGIARELQGETDLAQTMVGTIRYMSPERLAGEGYGVAADVWSLGVVLLEMAARKVPFETNVSQIDLHDRLGQDLVVEDLIKIAPGHSPQFEEVLCGCLQPHPEARLTPEQLLELEWFRQFRDPAAVGKSVAVGATENGQEGVTPGQVKSGGEDCDANNGDIENQPCQDLDRATQAVREHISKAVEAGALVGDPFDSSPLPPPGTNASKGLQRLIAQGEAVGDGLIQTFCSDADLSDESSHSPDLNANKDPGFGLFGGFGESVQDGSNRTGA